MERKRAESSGTVERGSSKKPRLEQPVVQQCRINPLYSSREFQNQLSSCWMEKRAFSDGSSGAHLLSDPFQCCVLPNFIHDTTSANGNNNDDVSTLGGTGFLHQLKDELLRLKFYEKNNDLYQFHQSDDLKKFKSPCITAIRSLFHDKCLPLLTSVTGIELTDTIDMTCSKYEYTDVLLCHDDQLEGRRIAFIFYLVPEWNKDDGGALDLFGVDEHGQPEKVVKSLLPVWNNFIFFDVNAVSFHQVAEVISSTKTRLSVNGWFHGPPALRPEPYRETLLSLWSPMFLDLQVLSEWVSPTYLDVGVQTQIQLQFEAESQIELPDFLLEEKYQLLCRELQNSDQTCWLVKGPPNKRHVHLAVTESLSPMVKSFMEVVQSDPFCRLLAHMTGLDLAHNIIKPDLSSKDGTFKSEQDREGEVSSQTLLDNPPEAEKVDSTIHDSKESTTNSTNVSKAADKAKIEASSSSSLSSVTPRPPLTDSPAAECHCELYRWQAGDYTLAGDESDPGHGSFCLDAVLSLNCDGWNTDHGGMTSYIAKGEDEELLSISPSSNALSLVYRDEDALRFTKYINHRAEQMRVSETISPSSSTSGTGETSFYSFTMLYKELGESNEVQNL